MKVGRAAGVRQAWWRQFALQATHRRSWYFSAHIIWQDEQVFSSGHGKVFQIDMLASDPRSPADFELSDYWHKCEWG